MSRGEFDDLSSMRREDHVIKLNQSAGPASLAERALEIAGIADGEDVQLHSKSLRGKLRLPNVFDVTRIGCVGKDSYPGDLGNGLSEQFQSLPH